MIDFLSVSKASLSKILVCKSKSSIFKKIAGFSSALFFSAIEKSLKPSLRSNWKQSKISSNNVMKLSFSLSWSDKIWSLLENMTFFALVKHHKILSIKYFRDKLEFSFAVSTLFFINCVHVAIWLAIDKQCFTMEFSWSSSKCSSRKHFRLVMNLIKYFKSSYIKRNKKY